MLDMKKINAYLDKSYILYILEKLDITPYQLSKLAGISNSTITRVKNGTAHLTWKVISRIENETGVEFKSFEHVSYTTEFYKDNPDLFKENQ